MNTALITNAFKYWLNEMKMGKAQDDTLSLASKQSLLSLVKTEINSNQKLAILIKNSCKSFYEMSDKDNPETLLHFNRLNEFRNYQRTLQKRNKKLARIAKELKLSMQ